MAFTITASAGGKYAAEEYAPPGIYTARATETEEFHTTEYNSDVPMVKMKVYFQVIDGPQAGKMAEQIYNPKFGSPQKPSNFRSVFTAIVGHEPVDGVPYDIDTKIIGKPCQIIVKAVGQNGRCYVTDVMPSSFGQAAAAPTAVPSAVVEALAQA